MAEMRTFYASGIDERDVARKVSSWLKLNDFEAQIVDLPDGRITVQARQPKSWRYILGMSSALNITLEKKGDHLVVETGAGSWAEKFAVGAVGIFILHPLLITMAYGVWKQSQLPEKVFEVVDQHLKDKRGPAETTRIAIQPGDETAAESAVPENVPSSTFEERICASCGGASSKEAKYCSQCGSLLMSDSVKIE